MKLSLVYLTLRPGGIDLLTESMTRQTFRDFELIVVDDCMERPLPDVKSCLRWKGPIEMPLTVIRSKPKTHPTTRQGLCNAMNTALLYVQGEYVAFLHDYTILPPDALGRMVAVMEVCPRTLIHGIAQQFNAPKPDGDGITTWKTRPEFTHENMWIPEVFELFWFGGPTEFFEDINGFDERSDHCGEWIYECLVTQAKHLGYKLIVDHGNPIGMIDHRQWDGGAEGQWRIFGHVTSQPEKPQWSIPSSNPFDLKMLRAKR